eukprot:gene1124-biopygen1712
MRGVWTTSAPILLLIFGHSRCCDCHHQHVLVVEVTAAHVPEQEHCDRVCSCTQQKVWSLECQFQRCYKGGMFGVGSGGWPKRYKGAAAAAAAPANVPRFARVFTSGIRVGQPGFQRDIRIFRQVCGCQCGYTCFTVKIALLRPQSADSKRGHADMAAMSGAQFCAPTHSVTQSKNDTYFGEIRLSSFHRPSPTAPGWIDNG